jgi:hypothetical protein
MARGHLFLIVVLLGAAAIAGLLAVSRTSAQSQPATGANTAISVRMKKLDRLEASLQRQIAARRKAPAAPTAPTIVYQRATAPASTPHSGDDGHADHGDHSEGRDD